MKASMTVDSLVDYLVVLKEIQKVVWMVDWLAAGMESLKVA